MTVWASPAGQSSRRIQRSAWSGHNHVDIWSKSPDMAWLWGRGSGAPLDKWGNRLVTDPLVLGFQASVNRPFINFPSLWRVSAHVFLLSALIWGDNSYTVFPLPLRDSFTVDRLSAFAETMQPVSQLGSSLSSPALCPSHLAPIFWVLPIPNTAVRRDFQGPLCIWEPGRGCC